MRSKKAVRIAAINFGVVAFLAFLSLATPLAKVPGPIHPVLVIPFFWFLFSFIPGAFGLGNAIAACFKREPIQWIVPGLLLNAIYLAAYGAWFSVVSQN